MVMESKNTEVADVRLASYNSIVKVIRCVKPTSGEDPGWDRTANLLLSSKVSIVHFTFMTFHATLVIKVKKEGCSYKM